MTMSGLRAATGILAVFWVTYLPVRATNFSGWDEWLVVDLTYRGLVALPYENRPFSLLFNLPGALLLPRTLMGYWLVHGLYLSFAGVLLHRLCLRLAPGRERLAFLAGVFAVVWAPADDMRLDAVLLANYSGFAFGTLLSVTMLVESAYARRRLGLALAAALAFVTIRGLESTAGLVLAAPALLWIAPRIGSRTRLAWSAVWLAAAGAAAALAAGPLLPGHPGSYQVSGLGFDPHPLRVASRLARQLGFHLGPLAAPSWGELLVPVVPAAVVMFVLGWRLLGRTAKSSPPPPSAGGSEGGPSATARMAAVGLGMALLAYGVLVLSASVVGPGRMQVLSAPGIGLFLAALVSGLAGRLPAHWGPRAAVLLGSAVVALGAGRTAALQREWDANSYWPAQDRGLFGLTRVVPQLEPHTLVVLLDGAGAWPAAFTFHHAVEYLYGGRGRGTVWGAVPFLYGLQVVPEGILSLPYESIRSAWRAPPALYRWDEVVVVRQDAPGGVTVLDEWPAVLPTLPPAALYAPRARIRAGDPRPPEHALLVGPAGEAGLR